MPAAWHALASASVIWREASQMSISPAANFLKPPPVPDSLTTAFTVGLTSLNSSATAAEMRKTVLEPSRLMIFVRPQPNATRQHVAAAIKTHREFGAAAIQ